MLRSIAGLGASLALVLTTLGAPVAASSTDFDSLIDEIGRSMLVRYPEEATDLGLSVELGLDDTRLNDLSPEYVAATAALARDGLERLVAVDPETLSADERITRAVAERYLDDLVTMAAYADHEYPVSFITGAHANFAEFMADVHPLASLADAEAYVARLRAAGEQLEQVAQALVRGIDAGNLPTQRGTDIAAWQLGQLVEAAERGGLLVDFEARLAALGLAENDRDRLLDEAAEAIRDAIVPAASELALQVRRSATRSDARPGVLDHPDGHDYYAAALRHHLTSSLSPIEVHELGLAEVERVTAELSQALADVGYDPAELGFARAIGEASTSIPAVPLDSDGARDAFLSATQDFIAGSQDAFAGMFSSLPAADIEVQRPRPGRESAAGAYYRAPPTDGSRPGIYYLALGGDSFPMDTYATTNYHEAVPGHHFQIALQRESEELPLLQRATTFTGYAEGWALYAERLAYEAGLYEDDPLGNIGRLRMELLRAARAVADTGIHELGWSRDETIDYLVGLGVPEGWAASEVDRYVVWPGQAPAYIIGMLEILRLREEAQMTLGDDFDLAGFHDAVLRHGSVPLEVLPMAVGAWVESVVPGCSMPYCSDPG